MSEQSLENPEKISGKSQSILADSGISYAQIPRTLFKLADNDLITSTDERMALRLFDHCHQKRKYPTFTLSHSEIAEVCGVSKRQSMYGMQRLIDLRLFSARHNGNKSMVYQWNEHFLRTGVLHGANFAPTTVQNFHLDGAELSPSTVQTLHHIYIEFILDYIYILYRAYFESNASLVKRVPGKRGQKGVPLSGGTNYFVTRKDAWREAIEFAYKKTGNWGRIYSALVGGFNIDGVAHPRAYLSKLVWDESHLYESRKKSHIYQNGHLDDDTAFLKFIQSKERGTHGEECSGVH